MRGSTVLPPDASSSRETMASKVLRLKRRAIRWVERTRTPANPWAFHPDVVALQHEGPTLASRVIVWSISIGLVAFVIWACCATLDVVASAPGKVVPDGRVKVVQSLDAALVKTIHVREGQRVRKGDALIDLNPVTSQADVEAVDGKIQVLQLDLQRLRQELQTSLDRPNHLNVSDSAASSTSTVHRSLKKLDTPVDTNDDLRRMESTLQAARDASFQASLDAAQGDVEAKAMDEAAAADETRRLQQALDMARTKEAKIRPFAGAVVPQLDYLKVQSELNDATNNYAGQQKRERAAHAAKTAAEHHLQQIVAEHRAQILADITEKTGALASLEGERNKAEQVLQQKELRAPVDGIVQNLAVTTQGGVVTPGQALVSVVPDGAPLVVEAMLSNEDVGYVQAGTPVRLKLDTYPFQKYGVWTGHVMWISPDAEEKNAPNPLMQDPLRITTVESSQAPTRSSLMYRVRVAIDPVGNRRHPDLPLRAGMTGQVDVITDHRKVIEFLTMPVSRYLDEGVTRR